MKGRKNQINTQQKKKQEKEGERKIKTEIQRKIKIQDVSKANSDRSKFC